MILTPKHIIFIAVSNYLTVKQAANLKNDLLPYKRLTDMNFIRVTEKYFDFTSLRDKPFVPEDIWLFNYLMYENKQKENQKLYEIGEKINFKGKLLKKGLLIRYENKIIMPQVKALQSANMILGNLY
jgi:hypothetical protein